MLLTSHISAYTRSLAKKVCSLLRSTWGTSQGEDKLEARDKILNTKVARRACAGRASGKHCPSQFPQTPLPHCLYPAPHSSMAVAPICKFSFMAARDSAWSMRMSA